MTTAEDKSIYGQIKTRGEQLAKLVKMAEDIQNNNDKYAAEAYQQGLNDAWEAAKKIVVDTDDGGIASGTLVEIFGTRGYSYIMQENTAKEAIDKIKAYEDKQKEDDSIKVGAVIANNTEPGIRVWVTTLNEMGFCGIAITDFGSVKRGELYDSCSVKGWHKTGRYYGIDEVLGAMLS